MLKGLLPTSDVSVHSLNPSISVIAYLAAFIIVLLLIKNKKRAKHRNIVGKDFFMVEMFGFLKVGFGGNDDGRGCGRLVVATG